MSSVYADYGLGYYFLRFIGIISVNALTQQMDNNTDIDAE